MGLNHQIRLCRPFPFLFGFRAISHNADMVTKNEPGCYGALVHTNSVG
jgi:hypothetical protein